MSATTAISREAQRDIEDLQLKIGKFRSGQMDEERFKSFRLTRGVYGQRQLGVQMFRLKIPYGKMTAEQLVRIADLSEQYTNGNLHTTTRQNIQLHFVKLDDTPEMWQKLEEVGVTTRAACGNTVRNITGSAMAGIDPEEPFDISPYAHGVFEYFLRNPVGQDMGRKIKMAFSSSAKDSAYTYFHDFGFIPLVKDGVLGFKVVVGGGLGAQSMIAKTAYEFLPTDEIIPFIEAGLRIFDRYGERQKREKARMKFLIDEKRGIGIEKFMELVEIEKKGLPYQKYAIEISEFDVTSESPIVPQESVENQEKYQKWLETNVFEQKQEGFYGVQVKLLLGNINSETSRKLAAIVKETAADDIRITVNQGLQLRFVRMETLPYLFNQLDEIGLAEPGFDTIADITACPGTDTCNLAVTNSTAISVELEKMLMRDFAEIIKDSEVRIKISGCMNSCGQHMAAHIGLHGSSIKNKTLVIPAMQVVLGGGVSPEGDGFIAEKVIKLPTKKIPQAISNILNDYDANAEEGEYFNDYFQRQGKRYFYNLLKPLADINTLDANDYIDWGETDNYVQEIGVGECASVVLDMVGTIISDAEERLVWAQEQFSEGSFSEAAYNSYSAMVIGAKALLLGKDVPCNTHNKIIQDFDTNYIKTGEFKLDGGFESHVLQLNQNEPTEDFAKQFLNQAQEFVAQVKDVRNREMAEDSIGKDKLVIGSFYKA